MKYLLIYLFTILSPFCSQALLAQTDVINAAIAYNDKIVNQQNKIGVEMMGLIEGMGIIKKGETELKLEKVIKTIQDCISEVKKLEAFEGNNSFRNTAISLFEFYKLICIEKYPKVIDILYSGEQTNVQIEWLNETFAEIGTKEKKFDENYGAEQHAFCDKYEIVLEKNKLMEKYITSSSEEE